MVMMMTTTTMLETTHQEVTCLGGMLRTRPGPPQNIRWWKISHFLFHSKKKCHVWNLLVHSGSNNMKGASSSKPGVSKGGSEDATAKMVRMFARQSLMELPYFDGSFKVWSKFENTFKETTKEGEFSNLENLTRLQKHLKGDALKIVEPLLLDSKNVPKIMATLKENFGNQQKIYKLFRNEVKELKNPRMEVPKSVIEFVTTIDNLVTNIKITNSLGYMQDQALIDEILDKLPFNLRQDWARKEIDRKDTASEAHPYEIPTLEDLLQWLRPQQRIAQELTESKLRTDKQMKPKDKVYTHQSFDTNKRKVSCFACNKQHKTTECPTFLKSNVEERKAILIKHKACFNCCNYANHRLKTCLFKKRCEVKGCTGKHHTLIHQNSENSILVSEKKEKGAEKVHYHEEKGKVLYQIIPVTLKNNDKQVDVLAFLDPGSSTTLILEEVARQLGISGKQKPLTLSWTNGEEQVDKGSEEISVRIKGYKGKTYLLEKVRTLKEMSLPTQSIRKKQLVKSYPYLSDVEFSDYGNEKPKLLIGLPHSNIMRAIDTRSGRFNEPIAQKTKIGWVIYGTQMDDRKQNNFLMMINNDETSEEKSMKEMMRSYFSTEEFGVMVPSKPLMSKQDERALQIMKDTINYTNGQYEIGLLWKEDNVSLPDSYQVALSRLKGQEKRMRENPELRRWYNDKILEYESKAYVRKLNREELMQDSRRTFYIPHFSVTNPNKIPRKPRLVFDAAAIIKGQSLNSKLLSGPDATTSLLSILIRFREGKLAVTGDIQEMFHQVKIKKDDQNSQRFLYRLAEEEDMCVYVMQVMTFGATCSPSCAQYVKNQNAIKFQIDYPKAVTAIIENHYVDDYLDSFDSIDEAKETVGNVIKIHAHGHFNIRNFVTNSKDLKNSLSEDKIMHKEEIVLGDDEQSYEKVLGVYWNVVDDTIRYRVKMSDLPEWPTKRQLLSASMSVYDPLGLISNVTIKSRILIQDLWKLGIGWDDKIPEPIDDDFTNNNPEVVKLAVSPEDVVERYTKKALFRQDIAAVKIDLNILFTEKFLNIGKIEKAEH
ncbi:uncharacterized protein LOC131428801 [Malaya genurostris]|uniref:uncharacterized protein LOC131428801 n=1 Tax=Malaya genurostris TaxID=325434 RepID=UPI0026F3AB30|nr:uncharacterized protein LOC131428801 [Malaya genurostris]